MPWPRETGKIPQHVRLDKCSKYQGLDGKLSCERGMIKCVSVMGKKIGCIGGSAYAYLNYQYAWMKADARGAAGFQLEFIKWGVKLFDTDNKAAFAGAKGDVNAYAKYFDIKRMKVVTLYSYAKKYDYNVNGCNWKADQQTKWSITKSYSKTFFKVEVCYGIPKIAAICGAVILSGSMGLRVGAGMIAPSFDAVLINLRPQAGLIITLEVSGQALGFKGSMSGSLTLVEGKLPAAAIFEFKHKRTGGIYLGWSIELLKVALKAGIYAPGLKKCERNMLGENLKGRYNSAAIAKWGRVKTHSPTGRKLLVATESTNEEEAELGATSQVATRTRVGWGRRRFFKAVAKVAKSVGKAVVKVAKAICRIPCTGCTKLWAKTILSLSGKRLGGTIFNKDASGFNKAGKCAISSNSGSGINSARAANQDKNLAKYNKSGHRRRRL